MIEKKKLKITYQEVYATKAFFNRFLSSLSPGIACITICSPFFDKLPRPFDNLLGFCRFLQQRGTERIVIITRPPGTDNTAITVEVARMLDAQGIEFMIRAAPPLHAKMYHIQYKTGNFRSFIGSANFTIGGLSKNHELMAEMEGVGEVSPCDREIASLLIGNASMTFPVWVQRHLPSGAEIAA